MHKKAIFLGLASALLLSSIFATLFVTPAVADPKTIRVPEDYEKIQWAVGNATAGDTIQVASGIYYENVKIGKSVKLIGEGNETTIIDGNGTDAVVYVTADNVDISGFTIRNGMKWNGGTGGFFPGIYLYQSKGSTVRSSVLSHNFAGISISRSGNILVNGSVITDNQKGIELASSSDNIIVDNVVTLNWLYGIHLFASDRNSIVGNNVSYNQMTSLTYGIYLGPSSDANIVYHNNFINNTNQAYENLTNTWDNGTAGNYWNDYMGEDLNGDGVGDTLLPHLGLDYYPLMKPWPRPPPSPPPLVRVYDYNVTWMGVTYRVVILTNSTVESFNFSELLMQVSFNVTVPPSSVGFCNVTIPIDLLNGVLMVRTDGSPIDYILSRNASHSFLYFNFSQGTRMVEIFDGLDVMKKSWFKVVGEPGYDERADVNRNGFVNVFDLVILGKYLYRV